ncbi:MAG: 4Fe-4S binding protein [Methanolobus sp.]|nr:4Fe-4S binding protein [Methanolobus sp.]
MKVNENCVGCGQCIVFCKFNAIKVRGKATITTACTECKACIAYCPVKAIEV